MIKFGFKHEEHSADGKDSGGGPTPEVITEAREMGWVPKEKWTGAEDKWVDADAYLARGEKLLPIVLSNNRALKKAVADLNAEMVEVRAAAREFRTVTEAQIKAKYAGQLAAALEDKKTAITEADGEGVVAAEAAIEALKAKEKQELTATAPKGEDREFQVWKAANSWYETDPDLQALADSQAQRIAKVAMRDGKPIPVGTEMFNLVKKEVMRLMPSAFEDEEDEPAPNKVAGGRETLRPRATKGGARTYDALPPEAKAACDRFVKQKLMTRDQYIADYDWS